MRNYALEQRHLHVLDSYLNNTVAGAFAIMLRLEWLEVGAAFEL